MSGGCIHALPRRRLYDQRRHKAKNRLSISLFATSACRFVDDETERKTQKIDEEWVGCTFFYSDRPVGDKKQDVYIDTWGGMTKASFPHQDIENVKAVFMEWSQPQDVHQLITAGLSRKCFDPRERRQFNESDLAEWAQWIKNKVMTILPKHDEAGVDKKKIISVPMRFVRTNRGVDDELQPKSRLILAGHADLAISLYRNDAPTTSHLAVLIATVLAVSYGWTGFFFDVRGAFLSGLGMERECCTHVHLERVCLGSANIHPSNLWSFSRYSSAPAG